MISFYPGPSRVHDEIPKYVNDALRLGIMSMNHRSEPFVAMSEKTIKLLKSKLGIPAAYTVFFTGSATECWEIIAQSLIASSSSFHLYSGSFGQKWFEYTKRLCPGAVALPFEREKKADTSTLYGAGESSVICLTHNETSNGTQVSNTLIRTIRKNNPDSLIAVDATSSMAGVVLDFNAADVWFASVQKCFGLPAGLALMICSPKAITHAEDLGEKAHYNSLTFMADMMKRWQTPFTPNVLGIYLLMRVLEKSEPIRKVNALLEKRYTAWTAFMEKRKSIRHLIENKAVRSTTVIPVTADPDVLVLIKKEAKKKGILLGEGYGDLKSSTFRIANFPALRQKEIAMLQALLRKY